MALKATVNRAQVQVSDMDRHYYDSLSLTIAQHPSETDKRMMVRLLAFVLNANEQLRFSKGLSEDSEPDIWHKDYSEQIVLWIELGEPDEKRIKKACSLARQVIVYDYQSSNEIWWQKLKNKVQHFDNLSVYALDSDDCQQMADMAKRSMDLTYTIDSGQVWVSSAEQTVQITPITLKS
ncbi:YaeQ family protein [Thalassotalea ponticola]|uniref:YaeQ family protein n=1 Tax=Thalassotalea ponticola TaxID=1523392 RepID=UPI0025B6092C|nr:YaeQ family protein [Thalassotalea ponticola]MDN3652201.1 YaeQ family protein [Thalassotalea ponticola]